tara:strand:- start:1190 stop:2182 length:993 start_codon:yes stop_codon:yes gene_type:complete
MPAVSKKQQRFFGMVRAAQKGEGAASPEVAKVASEIKKKDAKDFASTKHKGLPMKKEQVTFGEWNAHFGKEPDIEGAIEYFYEEGLNEEGIDQLIEEIGLETFIDFVEDGTVELNEERAARRATVRAKKYDVVKKEVDKADAARKKAKKGEYAPSYAKKETDVTVYDDKPAAKKKAPAKKATPAKKAAPAKKPAAPKKPVTKKVVKAVSKVKKTQPAKKATKQGLGDKIRSAYKAGVKRHRKATQGARVFAKGFKSGAKKAVKFAKDVKKVVSEEVTFESWKEKAGDAIKKALKKKDTPKHDYGRDAGAEAAKRLRKKDHEKVNFLDPDD